MKKAKSLYYQLATVCTGLLSMMVIVFANTNSCLMIHEPERPATLKNYSRIK